MDFLKGLIYLETQGDIERWCLAVEDPENKKHTRIIKCSGQEARNRVNSSRKRAGFWKFKAFRFKGNIEIIETIEKPISLIMMQDIPSNLYHQIPISELRKLKEWTD